MCNICARCSKTMLVFWEILLSLSARRVWIEIFYHLQTCILFVSLSARRVWIEIYADIYELVDKESLSARRVWIEIHCIVYILDLGSASLSARRVWIEMTNIKYWPWIETVTLREEGVD